MAKVCNKAFDPEKSAAKAKAVLAFLTEGHFEDVTKIPSIGKVFAEKLQKMTPPINTVYQLMGRFLQFRRKDISQEQWCQSMYNFVVVNGARTDYAQHITYALAECVNLYFPDLYDGESFEESKADDFVELPTFSLSGEGAAYKASASTATAKAIETLISNSTDFDYCNYLGNIKSLGFGKVTLANLAKKNITSLYQIYGVFLGFHSKAITQEQWTQLCYRWCIDNGCSKGHSAGITDAICNVLDTTFPGLYDREEALEAAAVMS